MENLHHDNREEGSQALENARRMQAVQEGAEQFRATFEQAAIGVAHVSADFKWLRVNQKLCEILGYPREELLQCRFEDITHPDDMDIDRVHASRMLAGEISTYSIEKRNLRKDRSVIWINLTVSLVRQPSGEPGYFITFIEDITERKRLEIRLLQEIAERQRSEEALARELEERRRVEAVIRLLNERLKRGMLETHHRVKNNLQIVTAMIDMQV